MTVRMAKRVTSRNKVVIVILFGISVIVIGLFLSFQFTRNNGIRETGRTYNKIYLHTELSEDADLPGEVTAPSDYFATNESMLTPAKFTERFSNAPPILILMKGYQMLNYKEFSNEVTSNPRHECIVIWATGGMPTIASWNSLIMNIPTTQIDEVLMNKQVIPVGTRFAETYKMKRKEGDIFVGYLPIGDKDDTSYYFHTCNNRNEHDFKNLIHSMKIAYN